MHEIAGGWIQEGEKSILIIEIPPSFKIGFESIQLPRLGIMPKNVLQKYDFFFNFLFL